MLHEIENATNSKLTQRAKTPEKAREIPGRIKEMLRQDLKKLDRLIPADKLTSAFNFFYYLRTQSVAEVSGADLIGQYLSEAAKDQNPVPITILSWDCPGFGKPYLNNGEITRDPQFDAESIQATIQRRRLIERAGLQKDLLQVVRTIKSDLPIEYVVLTSGLDIKAYYPTSTVLEAEGDTAIEKATQRFIKPYSQVFKKSVEPYDPQVILDLEVYPKILDPQSDFWKVYNDILSGRIPIPEFVLKTQMEINKRITDQIDMSQTPQAEFLAKRVIAAYGAEGFYLDKLTPTYGNIIIAASEAISVYYQRANFARKFLGLKSIPTFYTLYE